MSPFTDTEIATLRRHELRRFVRRRYGLRGTLALHRDALGWDLARAPLNVALSPVFLVIKLVAGLLTLLGARRAGMWLADRQIFLKSDVARRIEQDLHALLADLDAKGIAPATGPERISDAIADHAEIRNAVADITTSLIVLVSGLILFDRATPGVISLAGPLAEMRAHGTAVENFWLGDRLGRVWYGAFPVELPPWQVVATGIVLALIASVVTTFAGLIADPVQVATGTHRRRLERLLARMDADGDWRSAGLAREHVLARMGDLSDAALSLLRSWRG